MASKLTKERYLLALADEIRQASGQSMADSAALSAALAARDICPRCGGPLDTGWECLRCGYDAIHLHVEG